MHACMLSCFSCVRFCTLWTAAHQAPLSMGFSRQEYWSGLPFPSPSFTDSSSQNGSPLGAPALLLDMKHHARPFPSAPSFNPCNRPLRSEEEGERGSPFRMEKLRLSSGFFHRPQASQWEGDLQVPRDFSLTSLTSSRTGRAAARLLATVPSDRELGLFWC